jgi:DNA gyrase subunit B
MPEYNADELPMLTLRDSVRRRPEMYFGSIDSVGIHEALKSLIETCVDEFRASQSIFIQITQTQDGWTVISDDGRGVRVDSPPEFNGRSFLEVALTEFLVNGFGVVKRFSYDLLPATPAAASEFHMETHRDGRCYRMGFTQGLITQPFTDEGPSDRRGTTMRWKPDSVIFQAHTVDTELLKQHLEILATVYCGLRIHFSDENTGESTTFYSPRGCADLLNTRNASFPVAYPAISIQMECEDVKLDVAFQHLTTGTGWIHSCVNGDITEDGSHVRGFLSGFASSIRKIGAISANVAATEVNSKSVLPRLTAILSIITEHAQYESPTRSVLHNPEIGAFIAKQVYARLLTIFQEHPSLPADLLQAVTGAGKTD